MLRRSLPFVTLVLVSSCVISVEPVVPAALATFDPALLGAWKEVGGSGRVVIGREGRTGFVLAYTSGDGKTGHFTGYLGRVGPRLLLDVRAAADPVDDGPAGAGSIRGHVVLSLERTGDTVLVAALQPDTLRAVLARNGVRLSHSLGEDQLVLTGTTSELRQVLGGYLIEPGRLDSVSRWQRVSALELSVPALPVHAAPASGNGPSCFEATSWTVADLLFHRDPHWLGADGASSVDLGGGRILWLFGDTWIDPSGSARRRNATMVSNSLAIQQGNDPATASIRFYWGRGADGAPAASFADRGAERLWLGNGVRIDDKLVLFFARVHSVSTGLGFESVGWTAVLVENPDDEPSAWRVTSLATPVNPLGVLVGYAAVLRLGEYIYAFGSEDPVKSHPVYAARWPVSAVRRGALMQPEWWGGSRGWVSDSSSVPRWPLFENGSSDLTLHFDPVGQQFVAIQTVGFGPADIAIRTSPSLTGSWTLTRQLFRPPEYSKPGVMIYSAKAHPELIGADLAVTYATNTVGFAEQLRDSSTYYPHFVRLMRCH